jgi:hypothetical protein
MARIHYHIERPGPRSRYILEHVLGRMAGWSVEEVTDPVAFNRADGPKLFYGHGNPGDAFHVVPFGLLELEGMEGNDPPMGKLDGSPVLFPNAGDPGFDVFAASFFLLSRQEEYGPIPRDEHGRPRTEALHAARHGYLQRPVVDEWLHHLADVWRKRDPRLPELQRRYQQVATLDADNGAMYLGKPLWRTLGGAARDLLRGRFGRVARRASVLAGVRPDPYAVHARFLELVEHNGAQAIINFLVAPYGKHDHAIDPGHRQMRACMQAMAGRAEAGLHPGYSSSDRPGEIAGQKQRLEALLGKPVQRSRQHFLRFRLPDTYRTLEELGIREEHSMGLADRPGFRAGTCTPFPFYDLATERCTNLMVHPFSVMDSALCYKMHLSPEQALEAACGVAEAVRAVQGTFISVWHERFLSDYGDEAGWGGVAGAVLGHAKP